MVIISSQSSTLWTRLIIIPLSLVVILLINSNNVRSRLVIVLYVMVFVGGLIVLLVSVSSLSSHEQTYNFDKPWLLFRISAALPFSFFYKIKIESHSLIQRVRWFENQAQLIFFSVFLILTCLIIVSKRINSFKGLIRRI